MPVPDYESLMLPLLLLCGDGKPRTLLDACARYHKPYQVAQDDKLLHDRFDTAKNLLVKACVIETLPQKSFQITPRGEVLLKTTPIKITRIVLQQYPEFTQVQAAKSPVAPAKPVALPKPAVAPAKPSIPAIPSVLAKPVSPVPYVSFVPPAKPSITPSGELAEAYKKHQVALATELTAQIKQASPRFFEKLAVDLLLAMGYGCHAENAVRVVGQIGDGGIDGILHEDPLGLSTVYVQAKKRGGVTCIGEVEVRNFVGALQRYQPCKGVFVTSGVFTDEAKAYIKTLSCKIALIDCEQLVKYMLDYGVGVSVRQTYKIKKLDTDYFSEE